MQTIARTFDPHTRPWRAYELVEGERISGEVMRLSTGGVFNGNRLFLRLADGDVVGIPAAAARGHTVLERGLAGVSVGDRIAVHYHGKRTTQDGERSYRHYGVTNEH